MGADEPLSAIKPSEYIQLLSVREWMAVCEWDDHTHCRGDEENGSFSQQYNDWECVQTKKEDGKWVFFKQSEQ